jgi:hypothetical protein
MSAVTTIDVWRKSVAKRNDVWRKSVAKRNDVWRNSVVTQTDERSVAKRNSVSNS